MDIRIIIKFALDKHFLLILNVKRFLINLNYKSIMKRILSLLLFVLTFTTIYSQSYLGTISKTVNFRQEPNADSRIISSLKPNSQIFIISIEIENDFYNIIDIDTDIEGYVHKSYVKIGKLVQKSKQSVFSPTRTSSDYDPEIKIFNNTSKTLTLKLNADRHQFNPYETKNIKTSPGKYDFRASAPGVTPYIGTESLNSNQDYSWQFYIVTQRR